MSFPFFFDGTSNIFINGSLGIGTTLPRAPFHSEGISYFVGNVGIGTTTPRTKLEIHSPDGVLLPRGTTAQRPSTSLRGYIRYNTDTNQFEGLGAADQWGSLGGVKSTDQSTYISAELIPGANDCNIRFYNNNQLNMIVNPVGNVGIGTTLPKYTLDVNGSIQATNYFGNASGLCNITSQLMWITGGGLRVANQKLVVDGDLFLGGQIFGGCNTSSFSGGGTIPSLITPNVVTSSNIVDGSITYSKLDPSAYNFQWMAVTGGGLRTTQKVIIDGDLILGGDIISSSNLNQLYPGGAILGCNIAVGAVTSSNIADGSITIDKLDSSAYNFQWMAITGGGLRTSQKVVIDSDLIIGGNIYNASNVNLNSLYPGGAILGCNIGVGVINTSNLVDRAVTIQKIDFTSNLPVYFGGSVGIGTTVSAASTLTVNGGMTVGTYSSTTAPANSLIISGSVGIGTTLLRNKLDVLGDIITNTNIGIGTTLPRGLLDIAAGTTSVAPLVLTSGTNLTTTAAGAVEYDGINLYSTPTVGTTEQRGVIPSRQQFVLSSAGSPFGNTINNFFGATSAIQLAASTTYRIKAFCYFLKTTAGTATWAPTFSSAVTVQHTILEYTPVTGFTTANISGAMVSAQSTQQTATTVTFAATASLTTAVYHIAKFDMWVTTNLATNLRFNLTQSAGTVTPQAGSWYTVTKIASNAGNFVA